MEYRILEKSQDTTRVTLKVRFYEDNFSEDYTFFVLNIDPDRDEKGNPLRDLRTRIIEAINNELEIHKVKKVHLESITSIDDIKI